MNQDTTNIGDLLSPAALRLLNERFSANATQWIFDNALTSKPPRKIKGNQGPTPKTIENPFYGFIGCTTYWGRYPVFAQDIIEGIARLDWHDRPVDAEGKSMPLSVRKLVTILESISVVTTDSVMDLLQLRERHARRYVKAIELIIPWMMKSCPQSLIDDMKGIKPEPKACEWDDLNDVCKPSAEELAKLHADLGTLSQFEEVEYAANPVHANFESLPRNIEQRLQHPKKLAVLEMLTQGIAVKRIERDTSVSAKTIRTWRNEMQTIQGEAQAA